jgi:voltage-gated potassium channel
MEKRLKHERYKLLAQLNLLLEGPMIFLGFVWFVLLIIDLVWGLNPVLELASITIWVIFILDFLLKLILAPAKIKYVQKNWLTAISLFIPALRMFRIVRFLRVFRGLKCLRLIRLVSSLNRSIKSLGITMARRGFVYVVILSLVVIFGGAAGMFAMEKGNAGFDSYSMALYWTAMRVITAGSTFFPLTPEGKGLEFMLAIYGYAVFGYMTATIATFFIGRDAEEENTPVAGTNDIKTLQLKIENLTNAINARQQRRQD